MENLLRLANATLNSDIIHINEIPNIDHLNKDDTNVDDTISSEIVISLNTIFSTIVPIIEFFTNPELTKIFFEQNLAITELLQIHFEYLESTKDNPDFNDDLLDDYLVNFYSYKSNTQFTTYLTCCETINYELNNIKEDIHKIQDSDTSDEELRLRELYLSGELVGGGLAERVAVIVSSLLLLGSSFLGVTKAEFQSNNQISVSGILPKNSEIGLYALSQDVEDNRFETDIFKDRVIVPKSPYTSKAVATLANSATSVAIISSLSTWFYGNDADNEFGKLLTTIGQVNSVNNDICMESITELSSHFNTFDTTAYDINVDGSFKDILTEAKEAVDEAGVKVEGRYVNSNFALGDPVNPSKEEVKTAVKSVLPKSGTVVSNPGEVAEFNAKIHEVVTDIVKGKKKSIQATRVEEKAKLNEPKFFYQVTFNKPGGLVMPIIVELTFEDGTTENHYFPAQIWRMNDQEVNRTFATKKAVTKIQVDPKLETADIDTTNNSWPKTIEKSKFD
jgi:hypothetical protein